MTEPVTVQSPKVRDHREAQAIKIIGTRLRDARMRLCNMSQRLAAQQLGLANSGMLAKFENATDNRNIPLWLIRRAAALYEVSIDWLFGETEDWETGHRMTQERETSRWLFDVWEKAREMDIAHLRLLNDKLEALTAITSELAAAANDASAALDRFAEVNPEFEDMPAGSPLVAAVVRIAAAAQHGATRLERLRCEMRRPAAA
ncbi:helix-turn-helix transcriptional regulator [uncultured Thiodictyon sp.]|uniref:helix-turn-helix domain-containing protein n=1 Tax=uncultured Thiodictyon sp. TaxID=1846217 RepID=UPI0025CE95B5|nr:helix-turn-helix transcriptional regulator [uncultured Thiodictyon sp.]